MAKSKKKIKVRKSRTLPDIDVVFVTETILPASETLFPEKLKKVNEMLSRTTFMKDQKSSTRL